MANDETKLCKHCQTEIPKKAKVCPNCRKKQKGKLGLIITIIVVIVILAAAFGGGSDSSDSSSSSSSKDTSVASNSSKDTSSDTSSSTTNEAQVEDTAEEVAEEAPIEYIQCTANDLVDALSSNALKASKTYKDQYIEVTGYFSTVDSSGDYFNIDAGENDFSFTNIQCFINDDLVDTVAEFTKGQKVTVKGYCSDVGEFLGYSIKVENVE